MPKIDVLAGKVARQHPRLFFPGDELARVRGDCAGPLRKEYAQLLADAKRRIGEPLVAEPPRLLPKGVARGAQYADIIRATRPTMDGMQVCALAYLLSGDRRFGLDAKRPATFLFLGSPRFHRVVPQRRTGDVDDAARHAGL